jgi:excisionase family DNA binding protein
LALIVSLSKELGRTQGATNMEILTAKDVAALLKISKRQVYELAKETENPIPSVRIRTSVRFRKTDVEKWFDLLVKKQQAA